MKKRISVTSSALFTEIIVLPALVADRPSRKAAPVNDAPSATWRGFYAGLNAGGTRPSNNKAQIDFGSVYSVPRNSAAGVVSNRVSLLSSDSIPANDASGFSGAGQIGFNNRVEADYLIRLEADFQGMARSNRSSPV